MEMKLDDECERQVSIRRVVRVLLPDASLRRVSGRGPIHIHTRLLHEGPNSAKRPQMMES